jgi:acetylornithine deacetylase/succinyl-diaminopimelate desuccinylase-like protein
MDFRSDAGLTAAEVALELERLTVAAAPDAVGTVGALALSPGLINVIPGRADLTVDARSASGAHEGVFDRLVAFARERAASRGQEVTVRERARVAPQPLSPAVADLAEQVARDLGFSVRRMPSGAVHDTQLVAASGVPSAMVFVPCRDGISHSPAEHAEPADAALAAHVCLGVLERLAREGAGSGA